MAASTTIGDVEAAKCLRELLEFAILRLVFHGELALCEREGTEGGGAVNSISCATPECPVDTHKPWEPW